MAKKATPKRPFKGIKSQMDVPTIWIGQARQFKRLEELNRPRIEEERANRDITRNYTRWEKWEKRPIPLDGFDIFLMGVAIENLLKGVLRAKGWSFKKVVRQSHELAKLYTKCCNVCELEPNNDERAALRKLEQFVIWVGKYNLPIDDLEKIMHRFGLTVLSSPYGPIITLEVSESERKSIYAVYERFLHYLTMGYAEVDSEKMRKSK
jgi:hypothetical protein